MPPRIYPLKLVVKYDPPLIGLYYKKKEKLEKKHIYNVLLNSIINLETVEEMAEQIFIEHPQFFNEEYVSKTQVQNLLQKIIDFYEELYAAHMQGEGGGAYEDDEQDPNYLEYMYQKQRQEQGLDEEFDEEDYLEALKGRNLNKSN